MRRLVLIAAALAVAACDSAPPSQTSAQRAELRTIDSAAPRPAQLDPPPVLNDEAPPLKPKTVAENPVVLTPEDEKLRAQLPFSPAIAMDPIDGSKISIRVATPTFEYKGKVYYFTNEANKRTFAANPDGILKGGYTKL